MANITNDQYLDLINKTSARGGLNASTFSILHGLNAVGGLPNLPENTDSKGLILFTKPQCNLSHDNVLPFRKLSYLINTDPYSMGNYIRCALNPKGFDPGGDMYRSKIIDDKQAFMPMVSNLVLNMSAPKDISVNIYTSPEGRAKEQVSWIDDKPGVYDTYQLTVTFANIDGDPISNLFSTWLEYGQRISEGSMRPFFINIIRNRIDYQTRIYRITLDRSLKYVQDIFATGAAFPTSLPIGGKFGITEGTHFNLEGNQIQINFQCIGAIYNDPLLILLVNKLISKYNPAMGNGFSGMTKINDISSTGLIKKHLLNSYLYPWINTETMELEWYAENSRIAAIEQLIKQTL
jgi:hypothetical protein